MMRDKIRTIIERMKKAFTVIVKPTSVYTEELYSFHRLSFAQDGEDIIISELFNDKSEGFYVDVGAFHPQRFSNTYYYYLQGWQGINIDATPGSMLAFNILRPCDINLEIPISDKSEILTYYQFDEPALNSFSFSLSDQRNRETKYKIVSKNQIETQTLEQILDKYLPKEQTIDFLSIDVEGLDYQVLKSNNWDKYKPFVILVEDLENSSLKDISFSRVYSFLTEKGYILFAKTMRTLIFKLSVA